MKRKVFVATMIALFAVCNLVSGQDLKPLKSFDGDENEYLKHNFAEGNNIFIGDSFGDVVNTIEVKFLTARIHCTKDNSNLFLELFLQSPEYVENQGGRKETYLTGIAIYFDK